MIGEYSKLKYGLLQITPDHLCQKFGAVKQVCILIGCRVSSKCDNFLSYLQHLAMDYA